MKFKYLYKVIALISAFYSGVCFSEGLPLQAVIVGIMSIAATIADIEQR